MTRTLFRPSVSRRAAVLRFVAIALALGKTIPGTEPIAGDLRVSHNPHYFMDSHGKALILNGSQSWNTFQDWGTGGQIEALDFDAFVGFLTRHGHNFTLLWTVEMPKFCGLPNAVPSPDFVVSPMPWQRTGPGTATDGALKFDLTKFNPAFFDRLRSRVRTLDEAGIYAGVYLFTGEFLNIFRCPSDGYPLTGANNINGVDDGYTGGKKGTNAVTMNEPNVLTKYQDAYVEKVIDTLNDLPNVLWIVSEEAPPDSIWWNDHQIAHIRAYESSKPHRHPIGYAAPISASDLIIYNSDADWVAPAARVSPVTTCGNGTPACKVNVNDSDHSYWEIWKQTPQQNRNYAWENFLNGNQVLFMDPYLVHYPRESRNLCVSPSRSICREPDSRWDTFRDNLGYILRYSRKLDLVNAAPNGSLSSTGFCLANLGQGRAKYLIYASNGGSFTVNLSALPPTGKLRAEWFNPATGGVFRAWPVPGGSPAQAFTAPFSGDAILYLEDAGPTLTKAGP